MENVTIKISMSRADAVRRGLTKHGETTISLDAQVPEMGCSLLSILSVAARDHIAQHSSETYWPESYELRDVAAEIERVAQAEADRQAERERYRALPIEERIKRDPDAEPGKRWGCAAIPEAVTYSDAAETRAEVDRRNKTDLDEHRLSCPIDELIVFSEINNRWVVRFARCGDAVQKRADDEVERRNDETERRNDAIRSAVNEWERSIVEKHGTTSQIERWRADVLPSNEFDELVKTHCFPQADLYKPIKEEDIEHNEDCPCPEIRFRSDADHGPFDAEEWARLQVAKNRLRAADVEDDEMGVRRHAGWCVNEGCCQTERLSIRVTRKFPDGKTRKVSYAV